MQISNFYPNAPVASWALSKHIFQFSYTKGDASSYRRYSTTKINSTFLNNVTTAPHSATCIRNSNSLRLGF